MDTPAYDVDRLLQRAREISFYNLIDEIEEAMIAKAMALTGQNCRYAAEILRLNRTTLIQKRKKLGMSINPVSKREAVEVG